SNKNVRASPMPKAIIAPPTAPDGKRLWNLLLVIPPIRGSGLGRSHLAEQAEYKGDQRPRWCRPCLIQRTSGTTGCLQQQCTQQLLWRNRKPPRLEYSSLKLGFKSRNASSAMLLGDCDDVEQPVSAALVGKELCAVREECRAIHAMPIPVLRAGELAELSFGECCCV